MSGIQPARNSRLWPLIAEAESPDTTGERLQELAQHPSLWVRGPVLANPSTPDAAILAMIADPRNIDRLSYFEALRGRPDLEATLSVWPDEAVRADLAFTYGQAKEGKLARATQVVLAGDASSHVRETIARTTTYRDLLDALLRDKDPKVRAFCADNPRIDREQMEVLLTDRLATVRAGAIALGHRYPDQAQLLRAASDRSSTVRWNVIFNTRSPREAIETIAGDADDLNQHHAEIRLQMGAVYSDQVIESQAEQSTAARPGEFDPL